MPFPEHGADFPSPSPPPKRIIALPTPYFAAPTYLEPFPVSFRIDLGRVYWRFFAQRVGQQEDGGGRRAKWQTMEDMPDTYCIYAVHSRFPTDESTLQCRSVSSTNGIFLFLKDRMDTCRGKWPVARPGCGFFRQTDSISLLFA